MDWCMAFIWVPFFSKKNQTEAALYLNYAFVWHKLFVFAVWNHCGILGDHEQFEVNVSGQYMSSKKVLEVGVLLTCPRESLYTHNS